MKDLLSDTLTRIRNAQQVNAPDVYLYQPISKVCIQLLELLYKEGYIRGYKQGYNKKKNCIAIKVLLKYSSDGSPVIKKMKRLSKPGRRIYTSIKPLWNLKTGGGIFILSTPIGLLTDHDARLLNYGGELICQIK